MWHLLYIYIYVFVFARCSNQIHLGPLMGSFHPRPAVVAVPGRPSPARSARSRGTRRSRRRMDPWSTRPTAAMAPCSAERIQNDDGVESLFFGRASVLSSTFENFEAPLAPSHRSIPYLHMFWYTVVSYKQKDSIFDK